MDSCHDANYVESIRTQLQSGSDGPFLAMGEKACIETSQICKSLPDKIWDLILAKTEPYTCLLFGRDEVIAKIEGIDVGEWMYGALAKGHIRLVRAFDREQKEKKTLTVDDVKDENVGIWRSAIDIAAKNGHIHVVVWLHENRKEGCTKDAMDDAAGNGHLEVARWLHENRKEGCTENIMDRAAGNGHLEVVQWLHDCGNGCTKVAMDLAAVNGHLDVVKWLHENRTEGCTTWAMDLAAGHGHVEVVQWLHEYREEGCTEDAVAWESVSGISKSLMERSLAKNRHFRNMSMITGASLTSL